LLAAALLALAAGPAAATVADALDCCGDRCAMADHGPSPETPAGAAECCVQAPATAPDAATLTAPPPAAALFWAVVPYAARHAAAPRETAPPRGTGPPPGTRRHLALSVLLV